MTGPVQSARPQDVGNRADPTSTRVRPAYPAGILKAKDEVGPSVFFTPPKLNLERQKEFASCHRL